MIIPNTPPLSVLLQADGVALTIVNHKNEMRGETIHQHALPGQTTCPVRALARRVAAVVAATQNYDAPMSRLTTPDDPTEHATAGMVCTAVRQLVRDLKLHCQGIHVCNVTSHSLRAGGAMVMKLNGCDLVTIMKAGRWMSLTFLTYIRNQIAHLGVNVRAQMANPVLFFCF